MSRFRGTPDWDDPEIEEALEGIASDMLGQHLMWSDLMPCAQEHITALARAVLVKHREESITDARIAATDDA